MLVWTYKVVWIHISMQHAEALPEFEVGMGVGRVHVECVVKPVVVELAYGGICTRVGTMYRL
jgi:hypothetical protein